MLCARCNQPTRDSEGSCVGCGAPLCEECAGDTGTCGRESCGQGQTASLDDLERESDQDTFDSWWKRQ